MGKIVISTNVSLDGVIQDPDGGEGFSRGGWFVQHGGKDLEEWGKVEHAEALGTAALLLGRRSDEWFGARWASRPGEWANRWNDLPKYVVSATLQDPRWTNVTVLTGNVADEVRRLKQEVDGDIVVYASYQLGRTLIEQHGAVSEPVAVAMAEGVRALTGRRSRCSNAIANSARERATSSMALAAPSARTSSAVGPK